MRRIEAEVYLVDTNAICELRKGRKADPGVVRLLRAAENEMFLPVQAIGELRFGVEKLKKSNDLAQAQILEVWVQSVLDTFDRRILAFNLMFRDVGSLMAANDQHPVDKQIAAIALVYDLTVVSRNVANFAGTGVRVINLFFAGVRPAS